MVKKREPKEKIPKVYIDKQGRRYIKMGKKKVFIAEDIDDKNLINHILKKLLVQKLLPRRRRPTTRQQPKKKEEAFDVKGLASVIQAQIERQKQLNDQIQKEEKLREETRKAQEAIRKKVDEKLKHPGHPKLTYEPTRDVSPERQELTVLPFADEMSDVEPKRKQRMDSEGIRRGIGQMIRVLINGIHTDKDLKDMMANAGYPSADISGMKKNEKIEELLRKGLIDYDKYAKLVAEMATTDKKVNDIIAEQRKAKKAPVPKEKKKKPKPEQESLEPIPLQMPPLTPPPSPPPEPRTPTPKPMPTPRKRIDDASLRKKEQALKEQLQKARDREKDLKGKVDRIQQDIDKLIAERNTDTSTKWKEANISADKLKRNIGETARVFDARKKRHAEASYKAWENEINMRTEVLKRELIKARREHATALDESNELWQRYSDRFMKNDEIRTGKREPDDSDEDEEIVEAKRKQQALEEKRDREGENPILVEEPGPASEIINPENPSLEAMPSVPSPSPQDIYGQQGEGLKSQKGLYDTDLDKIMSKIPSYLGTISADEIPSQILPKVEPQSRGSFIMNLDNHDQPGSHWVAVYFDARPEGSNSIEYFDSFAMDPPPRFMKDIRDLADKLDAKKYLQLKVNKVKHQMDDSYNCGWHSAKFIMDRMRGRNFKEATG